MGRILVFSSDLRVSRTEFRYSYLGRLPEVYSVQWHSGGRCCLGIKRSRHSLDHFTVRDPTFFISP